MRQKEKKKAAQKLNISLQFIVQVQVNTFYFVKGKVAIVVV